MAARARARIASQQQRASQQAAAAAAALRRPRRLRGLRRRSLRFVALQRSIDVHHAYVHMPTHPLCRHIVRNTVLLATISLAAIGTAKRDFSVYNSCQECLAGGYGWSLKKSRCGNYVMRDLSRCPHQAEPAASSAKEASVSRDSFPMSSQAASGATHDH
eukprot:COSAG01_NODE_7530_length_3164_cov_21.004241_1_plen_159_part_10